MLEVICGPMYSGKSTELIRRLDRARIGGKQVRLVRPSIDDRFSVSELITHNGARMESISVNIKDAEEVNAVLYGADVVGIDEVQFFEPSICSIIAGTSQFTHIIVAGLDMTYRGEPFGSMPFLMAVADKVDKVSAVCHICGEDAVMTQRLIDGKPAPASGPTVLVGGLDSYEARCRRCWELG